MMLQFPNWCPDDAHHAVVEKYERNCILRSGMKMANMAKGMYGFTIFCIVCILYYCFQICEY
jgi:hypothetical protein